MVQPETIPFGLFSAVGLLIFWVLLRRFISGSYNLLITDFSAEIKTLLKENGPLMQPKKLASLSAEKLKTIKTDIRNEANFSRMLVLPGAILTLFGVTLLKYVLPTANGENTLVALIGLLLVAVGTGSSLFGVFIAGTMVVLVVSATTDLRNTVEEAINKSIGLKTVTTDIAGKRTIVRTWEVIGKRKEIKPPKIFTKQDRKEALIKKMKSKTY